MTPTAMKNIMKFSEGIETIYSLQVHLLMKMKFYSIIQILENIKMTDLKICELIGMSPQNLRATYKKSDDKKKRLMYEALKIGLETIEKRKTK